MTGKQDNALAVSDRLLIVDDEPAITQIVESAACELGLRSFVIHDSDQFETALDTIKPTIIFLDVVMPHRDGVELIAHLAARKYPGRLVIMSGQPLYLEMSFNLANAQGLRPAALLTKPFRKRQIRDLLRELAARSVDLPGQRESE